MGGFGSLSRGAKSKDDTLRGFRGKVDDTAKARLMRGGSTRIKMVR